MSGLTVFNFEGQEVRFVGTSENPEWIAQDVCNVLDIAQASDALRDFDDDERGMVSIRIADSPGRKRLQKMLTVKEPGLYRLIFKSKKEAAKRFQKWVVHEVLPSIRKTGKYDPHQKNTQEQEALAAEVRNKHRKTYPKRTEELLEREVRKITIPHFANQDYKMLRGKIGKRLREELGITKRDLIIDHLETDEQALLVLAHTLQIKKMRSENVKTYYPLKQLCGEVTSQLVDVRNDILTPPENSNSNRID